MEALENGVEVAAQTSVVTAVNGPATPMKNPWKSKYLILKRKCDQIDQVRVTLRVVCMVVYGGSRVSVTVVPSAFCV